MARKTRQSNTIENRMIRALDTLSEYESYTTEVLPLLRKAISEGWSAEKIENHPQVKAALVARQLSIALKDPNVGTALTAIKDSRDRISGKATENRNVKMSIESASDEALDAKLRTLLGESPSDTPQTDDVH